MHQNKFNRLLQSATIFLFLAFQTFAFDIFNASPQGAINDFSNVLSSGTKQTLGSVSTMLSNKTGVSLVLVTIPTLDGNDINDFATRLFEKWGIGKKGVDEGLLVLIATQDRQIRIETGYGSEGYVPDILASRIIRENGPLLTQQNWDKGSEAIMLALASLAAKAHNTSLAEISSNTYSDYRVQVQGRPKKINAFGLLFAGVILLFLLSTRGGRSLLFFMLLSSISSGRSSGKGFGGGFGGGGFSGFGGGMSGGGGASGRF